MSTTRQEIMDLLLRHAMNARDLSQELRISEKEVYEHLPHIAKTVFAQGRRLRVVPFRCLSCGYEFRNRSRFTAPGRCPRCRETRVEKPCFVIR